MRKSNLLFGLILACAATLPIFAAIKGQVVCTESEPAGAPVHFRFENGGTQPEIILDIDYVRPEQTGRWEQGRSYTILIDDRTESAAPDPHPMFVSRTELTSDLKSTFRLTAKDAGVSTACQLNWTIDPPPASSPWLKTGKYSLQILETPGASQSPAPAVDH